MAAAVHRLNALWHAIGKEAGAEIGDLGTFRQQSAKGVKPTFWILQAGVDISDAFVGHGRLTRSRARAQACQDRPAALPDQARLVPR